MKEREYQTANRERASRWVLFKSLIEPRLLDGLTFEDTAKKIAATLKVSIEHARRVRAHLVEWGWAVVEPSKFKITQKAWDEFNGEKEA
jgi:hypothetical protein